MLNALLEIQNCFKSYKNIHSAFESSCKHMGEFLDAHRIVIFDRRFDEERDEAYISFYHEWADVGRPLRYSTNQVPRRLYLDDIYKAYNQIAVESFFVLYPDRLNKKVDPTLREFYRDSDIKSVLILPIIVHNEIWGSFTVHDLDIERDFEADGTVQRAVYLAGEISSFIERVRQYNKRVLTQLDDHSYRMESLGRMAASIAHEINNPIFLIGGFATRIEQIFEEGDVEKKSEEVLRCLDLIQKSCKKTSNIIEGLRLMSRPTKRDELEVCDLKDIINRTVDISKERLQFDKIEIIKEFNDDQEFLVECKPGQLSQVLTNLVNNSFDSLIEKDIKRWIKIECTKTDSCVKLSFTDAGQRPSDDIIKNMIEPFYTTKPPGKGTGLGLSLCKEIIKRFNGNFDVDRTSEFMKFDIELPLISFDEDE
ncbi:sensor histidine kinase [Bacteriovorax sp. Seq25_V]|uniref:sensor histidine kinase n=1 Tax=Bacteriovorax sp. Seq25_V TaxID=1201288 RepID=UPI00038A03AF|nr:GAF domain-containing sensor histidine kinase [Bacteriovorax sp. Seq25_V]EQC46549.1 GHKL domain protein [Bacteriovorax sp. Seq25_V]